MKKIAIALFSLMSVLSFGANENIVRKISVTGNAEREVMPDLAKINFKVEVKGNSLNQATSDVNKKVEKFKNELRSRKISLENLETKAFYNRKGTEYNDEDILDVKTVPNKTVKNTDKKPTSYDVNMSMLVKNTDFNKISALIDLEDGDNLQSIQKNFDENTFAFNINENGTTVDQALNKVFNKLNTSRRKLISAGIPESDIILSDYTIKENYTADNKNSRKDVYYVTNEFVLTTKNIKELNTIISIADDNGININGSINFDLSDKDRIESEMYKDAYNQTKQKAESILRSSKMKLGTPIIVSEDVEFQQKMIDRIDQAWEVKYEATAAPMAEYSNDRMMTKSVAASAPVPMRAGKPRVDYTPKPLKLVQNISVMYEMK